MRSVVITYILWAFLGMLSAHRFYLGLTSSAFIRLFTLQFFFVGLILDLFLIPGLVRKANEKLEKDLAARIG